MNNNTNTNNQEATKQQETVKTSGWCKAFAGLAVTTAIAGGAYYICKKLFGNNDE